MLSQSCLTPAPFSRAILAALWSAKGWLKASSPLAMTSLLESTPASPDISTGSEKSWGRRCSQPLHGCWDQRQLLFPISSFSSQSLSFSGCQSSINPRELAPTTPSGTTGRRGGCKGPVSIARGSFRSVHGRPPSSPQFLPVSAGSGKPVLGLALDSGSRSGDLCLGPSRSLPSRPVLTPAAVMSVTSLTNKCPPALLSCLPASPLQEPLGILPGKTSCCSGLQWRNAFGFPEDEQESMSNTWP